MALDATAPVYDRGGRGSEGRVDNLDIGTVAASKQLLGFGIQLRGYSIAESAGAAAKVRLRDGRDAQGAVMAVLTFLANGSVSLWLGEDGVTADAGLFLEVVSGSVEGAIYFGAPQLQLRR